MSPLSPTIASLSFACPFVVVSPGSSRPVAVPEPPKMMSVTSHVRPLGRRVEREEIRVATDDVVLALVAEDDVVAAVALDVVARRRPRRRTTGDVTTE